MIANLVIAVLTSQVQSAQATLVVLAALQVDARTHIVGVA
jgi:hypothetical protein